LPSLDAISTRILSRFEVRTCSASQLRLAHRRNIGNLSQVRISVWIRMTRRWYKLRASCCSRPLGLDAARTHLQPYLGGCDQMLYMGGGGGGGGRARGQRQRQRQRQRQPATTAQQQQWRQRPRWCRTWEADTSTPRSLLASSQISSTNIFKRGSSSSSLHDMWNCRGAKVIIPKDSPARPHPSHAQTLHTQARHAARQLRMWCDAKGGGAAYRKESTSCGRPRP
jgi:hypothetical protein